MNLNLVQSICETRMLVGFLGEKDKASWWASSFLSPSSRAFLAPIFPNSIFTAQYSGICQAASLVHDEHIGIGKHYHLYRLPDSIERSLLKCIQNNEFAESVERSLSTQETAINRLLGLGSSDIQKSEGPIAIGDYSDDKLDVQLRTCRAHYISAIQEGYKTFPYMRCS